MAAERPSWSSARARPSDRCVRDVVRIGMTPVRPSGCGSALLLADCRDDMAAATSASPDGLLVVPECTPSRWTGVPPKAHA
jgi:hypothetical protein